MINAILTLFSNVAGNAPAPAPTEGFQGLLNLLAPSADATAVDAAASTTEHPVGARDPASDEANKEAGTAAEPEAPALVGLGLRLRQGMVGAAGSAVGEQETTTGDAAPRQAGSQQAGSKQAGPKQAGPTAAVQGLAGTGEALSTPVRQPSEDPGADGTAAISTTEAGGPSSGTLAEAPPRDGDAPRTSTATEAAAGAAAVAGARAVAEPAPGEAQPDAPEAELAAAIQSSEEGPEGAPAGSRAAAPTPTAGGTGETPQPVRTGPTAPHVPTRPAMSRAQGAGDAGPGTSGETGTNAGGTRANGFAPATAGEAAMASDEVRELDPLTRITSDTIRGPDGSAVGGEQGVRRAGPLRAAVETTETMAPRGRGASTETDADADHGRPRSRGSALAESGTGKGAARPGPAATVPTASGRVAVESSAAEGIGNGAAALRGGVALDRPSAAGGRIRVRAETDGDREGHQRMVELAPLRGSSVSAGAINRTGNGGPTPVATTDAAERAETIESIRHRESLQPVHRVSLRVGEGETAARVRVDLRGDAVRTDISAESGRLANRLGQELPELSRALRARGLEVESTHVRHGERVVAAEGPVARPTGGSRGDAGHQHGSQRSGSQPHAQDGRERRRDPQEQEGDE